MSMALLLKLFLLDVINVGSILPSLGLSGA